MGRFDPPNDEEIRKIERLERVIDAFRDIDPAMPSSYIRAFLAVAKAPGFGSSVYAREIGAVQAVASRILLELGQKTRSGGMGYGLLDSDNDPIDFRLKRTFLTPLGRSLWRKVLQAMGNSP